MLVEELKPMSEEDIDALWGSRSRSARAADDEDEDEGDPSVFTLFDPVYEVNLGQYWYSTDGRGYMRIMKTRTNEVVFMEEVYSDNPGAEARDMMVLPEELRPAVRVSLVVSYENWSGNGRPSRVVVYPDGRVQLQTFEGTVDGNVVRLSCQSFNICGKYYLEE